MAKKIVGEITDVGSPRIKRGGDIAFASMSIRGEDGRQISWTEMAMERPVAELLHPGAQGTIYFSTTWSTVYGFRGQGGEMEFRSSYANPVMLLMSIGLLFGGLVTAMFLFPLLIALAGLVGIFVCLDARRARAMFRKDGKQAPAR